MMNMYMYVFFLDVIVYLSKELDKKSLLEKISFIWSEWTRKDDLYDKTRNSMGSSLLNLIFWVLR